MTCEHSFGWVGGGIGDKVWKIDQCSKCKEVRDVRVKEMHPKQAFPDPMQKYYDQMFRCYDAVVVKYPTMSAEDARHMAISLFIQTGGRV